MLFLASFLAGFLFQAIVLLKGKGVSFQRVKDFVSFFLLTFFFLLLVMYLGQPDARSNFAVAILMFPLLFLIFFVSSFWKELMPVVSEKTILIYSIAFAYLVFLGFGATLFSAVALLPVAASVANAFVHRVASFLEKVFFYAWFIAVTVVLGVYQIWQLFAGNNALQTQTGFGGFFLGASILFLGVNTLFLQEFIPITGKTQSMSNRLRQLGEYLQQVSKQYSDFQMSFAEAAVTVAVLSGFLFLTHFFGILSPPIAISLVVLLPQLWGGADDILREKRGL